MKLYLGVDGGQSGTAAVIGDENGRVLGEGEAGPCNHAAAGEGRAKLERAVTESVSVACTHAGLDARSVHFESACFGMSGGPEDKREILAAVLRTDRLIVTTDAVTALAGATEWGRGIIVIAGTGSIAFGRNAAGKSARAGGWGYVFGDEAGAFDLVRQSLRAALRMEEGWGPPTSLREVLLGATGARNANEALHLFYTDDWPRSRVATLAPLVDQAAMDGDRVAARILTAAAQELATLAAAVRGQLWPDPDTSLPITNIMSTLVEVAYVGGVFQSLSILERFRALVELEPNVRCQPPLRSPAEGALLEAIRESEK